MSEKHVLLLDGDDNRRRELVQLLREAGIVVVAERTGAEASAAVGATTRITGSPYLRANS